MGVIRGRHTAPGVYTKYSTIRMDVVNTDLQYNNTSNMVVGGGADSIPFTVYFGYYPLKSNGGVFDESVFDEIKNTSLKDIVSYYGIKRVDSVGWVKELPLTQHVNAIIPVVVGENDLRERIGLGDRYSDIADENNNCVIMVVPRYKYEKNGFDIVDERIEFSIYNKFNYMMTKSMNGVTYNVFVMYNNTFAYSRVGIDKAITPVKLVWK